MKLEQARKFALSLPDASEAPHFEYASFRIAGKIFATAPPDGKVLHVFVPDEDRDPALILEPEATEKLFWGGKVVGLRIHLAKARKSYVEGLLRKAHAAKAKPPARRARAKSV